MFAVYVIPPLDEVELQLREEHTKRDSVEWWGRVRATLARREDECQAEKDGDADVRA